MNDLFTANDLFCLLPAIMLAIFGCALLMPAGRSANKWLFIIVTAGLGFTGWSLLKQQLAVNVGG